MGKDFASHPHSLFLPAGIYPPESRHYKTLTVSCTLRVSWFKIVAASRRIRDNSFSFWQFRKLDYITIQPFSAKISAQKFSVPYCCILMDQFPSSSADTQAPFSIRLPLPMVVSSSSTFLGQTYGLWAAPVWKAYPVLRDRTVPVFSHKFGYTVLLHWINKPSQHSRVAV